MKFSKPFRFFTITLLSLVTLIVISSAILSVFYEKAIVRYLQNYLNEHLLTELSMKEVRFRVLKGFPNATVEISNPVVLSGENFNAEDFGDTFADTLLQAKSISFQFDLLKLLHKRYELKKIEVVQGRLNILWDRHNRHNLNIWENGEKETGSGYSVNLKGILLSSCRVRIISLPERFRLSTYARRATFRGSYSNGILSGETRGNFVLDSITIRDKALFRDASLHVFMKMAYGAKHFRISQGKVHLNKAVANISGEYVSGKENTIDLTLGMPKFGLAELMSLLPADDLLPDQFGFSGNGKLTAVIKGSLSDRNHLLIRSVFELNGCTARNKATGATISNINLKGSVAGTRPGNFELRLDRVNADQGSGKISGAFVLRDLNALLFSAAVHGDFDLAALREFAGLKAFDQLEGFVNSDFSASGSLKQLNDSAVSKMDFLENGTFAFREAGIKMKDQPWDIQNITGKVVWNKSLRVDSLTLRVNGTDLLVNGSVQNLAGYLIRQCQLESTLEIITDNLNIDNLLAFSTDKKKSGSAARNSLFYPDIQVKARLKAKNFVAGKFIASDVSVNLQALGDSLYVRDFFLRFPDGSITGNAMITRGFDRMMTITCNSRPQMINIQQLFTAFNNFTQNFIIDKNVKGLLGGTVSFTATWDPALKYIPESLKAQADIEITNGELVQFEPMLKLSKYISVEELRHIRFKTLKNVIYINNRLVTLPEMNINSTAFNIAVSGQHSFDNQFDYRMRVLLSEVLFNKARKKKQEINDFLIEENQADQTTIPLIIAGTPENFDVRFDRRRAFDLTHKNLKEESSAESKPSSDNFKIEWEEPVKKQEEVSHPESREDGSDFIIEWNEDEDSVEHVAE
jgi:hypothetical protein